MNRLQSLPLLALLVASGCQNNTIELETDPAPADESGDDTSTGSGPSTMTTGVDTTSTTTPSTTGDPGGPQTLLLALSTPLQPTLPFQALINATPGSGAVDITLQWLSLNLGDTTQPRMPVGDVYGYTGIAVDGSGVFFLDTGIILIPGAANPITGEDLVVSIQANAVPAGNPAFCGDAGGAVISPVETTLDGSTHAMTVVDPANLPSTFAFSCP